MAPGQALPQGGGVTAELLWVPTRCRADSASSPTSAPPRRAVPTTTSRGALLAYVSTFLVCLVLCVALVPRGAVIDEGISYFGTRRLTLLPYCIGVWSVSLASWHMAREAPVRAHARALRAVGTLLALIVLVPYSFGPVFNAVHVTMGSTACSLALAVSVASTRAWHRATAAGARRRTASVALLVEVMAWAVSCWWIVDAHGHLIWAQVAFLGAFLLNAAARTEARTAPRSLARQLGRRR